MILNIHNKLSEMPFLKYLLYAMFAFFILSVFTFDPSFSVYEMLVTNDFATGLWSILLFPLNFWIMVKLGVAFPLWLVSLPFRKKQNALYEIIVPVVLTALCFAGLNIALNGFSIFDTSTNLFAALIILYTYALFKHKKEISPFWATATVVLVPTILLIIPEFL